MENKVRIIGGQWRGRKLQFPDTLGLRPTHDRLRETLFNWLMDYVEGAVCLDLFAGSGALGFEALSRGAAHVTFVDNHPKVISALQDNAKKIQTPHCEFIQSDYAEIAPKLTHQAFDIVFLDPPYHQNLAVAAAWWLNEHHLIKKNGLVYVETEKMQDPLELPPTWKLLKEKSTSTLQYCLYLCA